MAAPRGVSGMPSHRDMRLPPVDDKSNVIVYTAKLPDDVVKKLSSGESTFKFLDATRGVIELGSESVKFATRATGDQKSRSRAVAYSRRGDAIRATGKIAGDIDVERKWSENLSRTTKKRTIDAENASKSREVKVFDDIHVSAPSKRSRRNPEKRQRNPTSAPVPRSRPNGFASRLPSNGSLNRLSVPATPPYTSPHVSPGHIPSVNGSRRGTPQQHSGYPPRSTPPPTTSLGGPTGTRVPSRHVTPTRPMRSSPIGSRGPSPAQITSAPSSPRVGSLRPKSTDTNELRRNVIHILALGETTNAKLRSRILDANSGSDNQGALLNIIREVGRYTGTGYVLKDDSWSDVSDTFREYSAMERNRIRELLAKRKDAPALRSGRMPKGSDADIVPVSKSSTDSQIEAAIAQFERRQGNKKPGALIQSAAEEDNLRQYFSDLYPLYSEVNRRLEKIREIFEDLGKKFQASQPGRARDDLEKRIASLYDEHRDRHKKFCKALPALHSELGDVRKRIEEWCSRSSETGDSFAEAAR